MAAFLKSNGDAISSSPTWEEPYEDPAVRVARKFTEQVQASIPLDASRRSIYCHTVAVNLRDIARMRGPVEYRLQMMRPVVEQAAVEDCI